MADVMLPLPSTAGRESRSPAAAANSSRRWRLLLIPAGVILFMILFQWSQPAAKPRGFTKYQMQPRYAAYNPTSSEYKFVVMSDKDTDSKVADSMKWEGIAQFGTLRRGPDGQYTVSFQQEMVLSTKYNEEGRGMELSDLVDYDGRLLTCDDRTGIVFELNLDTSLVIPRHILVAGDGENTDKGLKCEWLFVKGDHLWAGSIGKEYVRGGKIVNHDNEWVKSISPAGTVSHISWTNNFNKLRKLLNADYPGYLVHEAIGWSEELKKYLVLPRRVSTEAYDEQIDEERGSNKAMLVDENWDKVEVFELGPHEPTHGFSSFKFFPWREHEVVALKSREYKGKTETYITVFDVLERKILLPETLIGPIKFEGIEFL